MFTTTINDQSLANFFILILYTIYIRIFLINFTNLHYLQDKLRNYPYFRNK